MRCKEAINTGTPAYPNVRRCSKQGAHEGWHYAKLGMVKHYPNMEGGISWPTRT